MQRSTVPWVILIKTSPNGHPSNWHWSVDLRWVLCTLLTPFLLPLTLGCLGVLLIWSLIVAWREPVICPIFLEVHSRLATSSHQKQHCIGGYKARQQHEWLGPVGIDCHCVRIMDDVRKHHHHLTAGNSSSTRQGKCETKFISYTLALTSEKNL